MGNSNSGLGLEIAHLKKLELINLELKFATKHFIPQINLSFNFFLNSEIFLL